LDVRDLLQTFAEVGIGLSGFTGIVVALQSRSGQLTPNFLYLLGYSIGSVLFSLLPLLLLVSLPAAVSWRISCGVLFLGGVAALLPYWLPGSNLRPKVIPRWYLGNAAIMIITTLALGCVALGFLPEHSAFVYAAAVFLALSNSFIAFVTILVAGSPAAQQGDEDGR